MSGSTAERGGPVTLVSRPSIRKLTNILRAPGRGAFSRGNIVRVQTSPASPAHSSFSLDSEYLTAEPHPETERANVRPLFEPAVVSEGDGESTFAARDFSGNANNRGEIPQPVISRKSRRASVDLADYARVANNRGYRIQPRLIMPGRDDVDPGEDTSDAVHVELAWKWGEQTKFQLLSPSERIGAKTHARRASVGTDVTFVESENRSPLDCPSPATPRPHSIINRPYIDGGRTPNPDTAYNKCSPTRTLSEFVDPEPLTKSNRRPRSASEPHSYPGTAVREPRHAETADSSSQADYIAEVPLQDNEQSPPSTVFSPPSHPTVPSLMPEDVYFTAAGRRESRIYISSRTAPSMSLMRAHHAHSSSDPVFLIDGPTSVRYAARTQKINPLPTRPFEDIASRLSTPPADGDSTFVSRKEELWSGEWNRDDIQDVIRELRSLK